MKKYIYFHICCINNWTEIVRNILRSIFSSGLYEEITEIRCCILGKREYLNDDIFTDRKIRIIYRSEDISLRELITLNLLLEDSKREDFYVLYLHSKGVSKSDNPHIRDWTNYMLYFNVHLYEIAVKNLKYSDACGVNYQCNQYSGNYWWSKSSYIRKLSKLPPPDQANNVVPETWLTSHGLRDKPGEHCKIVSLWRSGVSHYKNPYPETDYKDCIERYDSRLKRLLKGFDYVVINNYKCGFSSSNLLETQKVLRIIADDKVILFYRNIFLRTVSTFINWCITNDRYRHEEGWLLINIKNCLSESEYKHFIDLFLEGRFDQAFIVYVKILERIYQKNNHTLPQVALLEYYNIDKIDHFIELENNAEFKRITGIEFPHDRANESNTAVKSSILSLLKSSDQLKSIVRHIYQKDISFFEGHGFSVDTI